VEDAGANALEITLAAAALQIINEYHIAELGAFESAERAWLNPVVDQGLL
jgi:hypothetical protein